MQPITSPFAGTLKNSLLEIPILQPDGRDREAGHVDLIGHCRLDIMLSNVYTFGFQYFVVIYIRICSRKRISCETYCHKLNHSGSDEGEVRCRKPLEILCQPAVYTEPCHRSFDNPALRQYLKSSLISFDDLYGSRACLFDLGPLIAALAADFLDEGKAVGEFVENKNCSVAIRNARRMEIHLETHAQLVEQNVALAALVLLARIITDITTGVRAELDRLIVNDGLVFMSFQLPRPAADRFMNLPPRPVSAEPFEIVMNRAFRRKITRQQRPLATREGVLAYAVVG